MRFQCFSKTAAQATSCSIHDTDTLALERADGGQDAYPSQPPVGAGREVKARRVGTVDNIDVVVARQHQHALGELRMARQSVEKLGPLRGAAGVGHGHP